jgi:two-component system nitrogen regulation sensor histidine kinase NtrY
LERKLAAVLFFTALVSGAATYLAMTGSLTAQPDPSTVLTLLLVNLVVLLLLVTVVARRLVALWQERRSGLAGARLHVRLVAWFGLVAMVPTVTVATFSALFLNQGMDAWFSDRVRTVVKDSLIVAESYLQEQRQRLVTDVSGVADALARTGPILLSNRERIERVLTAQVSQRALSEAALLDGQGQVVAQSGFSLLLEFDSNVPEWAFERARAGDAVILSSDTEDRVRALIRFDAYSDTFLLVSRLIDSRVLNHVDKTAGAARLYEQLEGQRSGLQITFALIFIVLALLILVAAVWAALIVATKLAKPIARLVVAAEKVGTGDLTARVRERKSQDEIGVLGAAFNRMTAQLQSQQNELIDANRQLETRRRFTELVLSGVSAGVIGLDGEGRVNLPNRSASALLGVDLETQRGQKLAAVLPEMGELLDEARRRAPKPAEAQITLERDGNARVLLVRVAAGPEGTDDPVYVVTFDDVTALLSAQRKAAWADVARRIAHEIKNPLTPIQLSAERLKRKYLKEIKSDPETFAVCTDTIVRQVGDIGRMVDEFSSFARMPAPVMRWENLVEICRQSVFLQQSAQPGVAYSFTTAAPAMMLLCDAQQVAQALTNLLQNAADSLEERGGDAPKSIDLRVSVAEGRTIVAVEDNGLGLPKTERTRLTEPYVTMRAKGTGLGLAIVKKIMEDHGGDLMLADREGGGASVKLVFPSAATHAAGPDLERAHGT